MIVLSWFFFFNDSCRKYIFIDIDYRLCFDFRVIKLWRSRVFLYNRNGDEIRVDGEEIVIEILFFFKLEILKR